MGLDASRLRSFYDFDRVPTNTSRSPIDADRSSRMMRNRSERRRSERARAILTIALAAGTAVPPPAFAQPVSSDITPVPCRQCTVSSTQPPVCPNDPSPDPEGQPNDPTDPKNGGPPEECDNEGGGEEGGDEGGEESGSGSGLNDHGTDDHAADNDGRYVMPEDRDADLPTDGPGVSMGLSHSGGAGVVCGHDCEWDKEFCERSAGSDPVEPEVGINCMAPGNRADHEGSLGSNWSMAGRPSARIFSDGAGSRFVRIIYSPTHMLTFKETPQNSGVYHGVNGTRGAVEQKVVNSMNILEHRDQKSNVYSFFGDNGSSYASYKGELWKVEDSDGDSATLKRAYTGHPTDPTLAASTTGTSAGFEASGAGVRVKKMFDSSGRRFTFSYSSIKLWDNSSTADLVRLSSVVVDRPVGSGAFTEVVRRDFTYYTPENLFGLPNSHLTQSSVPSDVPTVYGAVARGVGFSGDLAGYTTTRSLPDGTVERRSRYFRYYTDYYQSNTAGNRLGQPRQLKAWIDTEGLRQYDAGAFGTSSGAASQHATLLTRVIGESDSALASKWAATLMYNCDKRVNTIAVQSSCGCGGGSGVGTYGFLYQTNPSFAGTSGSYYSAQNWTAGGWKNRVVITMPENHRKTVYYDQFRQRLAKVVEKLSSGSVQRRWITKVDRDSVGRIVRVYTPSAVDSANYLHDTTVQGQPRAWGAIPVKTNSGLIRELTYADSTRPQNMSALYHRIGTSGSLIQIRGRAFSTAAGSSRTVGGASGLVIHRPTPSALQSFTAPGSSNTVSVQYDSFYADPQPSVNTTGWRVKQKTVLTPAVSASQNGSNQQFGTSSYYRTDGKIAFTKRPDGTISAVQYTANGQIQRRLENVNSGVDSEQDGQGKTIAQAATDFGITLPSPNAAGSQILTHSYDALGTVSTTTLPSGRVVANGYGLLADGRKMSFTVPSAVTLSGVTTYSGPVEYSISNAAGKVEASGIILLNGGSTTAPITTWIDATKSTPVEGIKSTVGNIISLSTTEYSSNGTLPVKRRTYNVLPTRTDPSSGSYDETTFVYNSHGRLVRTTDPTGTVTEQDYDPQGNVVERRIGTTSSTPKKVASHEYDDRNNLVKTTLDVDGDWATTSDQRVTEYIRDYRGFVVHEKRPLGPHPVYKRDLQGRVLAVGMYSTTNGLSDSTDPTSLTQVVSGGSIVNVRLALSESFYDERGQVWKSLQHKIDQASGASLDTLATQGWYDDMGRLRKQSGASIAKMAYDALGRVTRSYVIASTDDTTSADALTLAGDVVLEENQNVYDAASGNLMMRVGIQRLHTDDATTGGPLDSNGDGNDFTVTASDVRGRAMISGYWYDNLDRLTDVAQFGTNSPNGNVGTYARKPSGSYASVPSSSAAALVSSTVYDLNGRVLQSITPDGSITQFAYDDAGRRTSVIENYTNGVAGGGPLNDQDRTTNYVYTNGLLTSLIAVVPGGTNQETKYFYGTTDAVAAAFRSAVTTNNLLQAVKYPDVSSTVTTAAGARATPSGLVLHTYDATGAVLSTQDQAGNVTTLLYDAAGRPISRTASTVASGFDAAVRRIDTAYDNMGRIATVSQYNATTGGSALDGVKYEYDGWGNLVAFHQDRNSAVATSGDHWSVSWTHEKASPAGGWSTLRTTGMQVGPIASPPSGVTNVTLFSSVQYNYNTGMDATISRVSEIVSGVSPSNAAKVKYKYLGASTLVGTTYSELGLVNSASLGTSSTLDAWDQFGRSITSRWFRYDGSGTLLSKGYETQITHDRASSITSVVDKLWSGFDVKYDMDGLDRLVAAKEGTVAVTSGVPADPTTPSRAESWALDQLGNWGAFKRDLDGDGAWTGADELNEARTHSSANAILTRTLNTGQSAKTLSHDAVGNMTDDAVRLKYEYDVFGRLVRVRDRANANNATNVLAEYRYNGIGYRIASHTPSVQNAEANTGVAESDPWFYHVYDSRWREVATFRGIKTSSTDTVDGWPKQVIVRHAAGLRGSGGSSYIDEIALREKDSDGGQGVTGAADDTGWRSAADGLLETRQYYCQNWRHDVVLLVDALAGQSGPIARVSERYRYSAYGVPWGLGRADFDGDGSTDDTDFTLFAAAYSALTPDDANKYWRVDMNLDGAVDDADLPIFAAEYDRVLAIGRGRQSRSDVLNTYGYAGYEYDHAIGASHVRNRVYRAEIGRWTRRDPLGYVDGMSLYSGLLSNPLVSLDSDGLWCLRNGKLVAEKGDTLWGLAKKIYGKGSDWCKLGYPKDPKKLRPGDELPLPDPLANAVQTLVDAVKLAEKVKNIRQTIRNSCNEDYGSVDLSGVAKQLAAIEATLLDEIGDDVLKGGGNAGKLAAFLGGHALGAAGSVFSLGDVANALKNEDYPEAVSAGIEASGILFIGVPPIAIAITAGSVLKGAINASTDAYVSYQNIANRESVCKNAKDAHSKIEPELAANAAQVQPAIKMLSQFKACK